MDVISSTSSLRIPPPSPSSVAFSPLPLSPPRRLLEVSIDTNVDTNVDADVDDAEELILLFLLLAIIDDILFEFKYFPYW